MTDEQAQVIIERLDRIIELLTPVNLWEVKVYKGDPEAVDKIEDGNLHLWHADDGVVNAKDFENPQQRGSLADDIARQIEGGGYPRTD